MEGYGGFITLILMFAVLYFILIRPQQKRQKEMNQMHSNLKKGDKIVTIGGLHAIIDAIDEDTIVLRAGDGSKLTYDRRAVREVVSES
ncbi:preprotein translocase subunit YajC [Pueribacillus theae]|uniref:Preprotein translocase subunit YajC n=1 Tax=Pueribacillus theae TaxID=2171751 RepID=A0A2U1K0M0_9BACI|nr:preprotein translocase subunit YajC [Pueribacillus theae]PWA10734.1 preprotein translocase subunit YajC [Pueribacillus theae]